MIPVTIYEIKNKIFYFYFWITFRLCIVFGVAVFMLKDQDIEFKLLATIGIVFAIFFIYYSFGHFNVNKIIYKIELDQTTVIVSYNYAFFLFGKKHYDLFDCNAFVLPGFRKYVWINKGYFLLVKGKIKGSIPLNHLLGNFDIIDNVGKYFPIVDNF